MRRLVIILLIIIALVISSCGPAEKECEKPFIESNGDCCLDLDDNSVCDEKQGDETEQEIIEEEPEQVIVEEKEPPESTTPTGAVAAEETEVNETEPLIEETQEEIQEPETKDQIVELDEYLKELKEKVPAEPETKMEELLFTFAQDVVGYKYAFEANWFFVRGDRVKIRLHTAMPVSGVTIDGKYYSLFYYDNVYLDRREETAQAYCEGTDPRVGARQCLNLKIQDIPFRLSFQQYYKKLPEEWLFEYLEKEPTEVGENKYYVRGRRTTRIKFDEGEKNTVMFFDEKTGLPIRVEIKREGEMDEIYNYEELSAGTVRAEDVRHRTAAEIPSTEVFYSTMS